MSINPIAFAQEVNRQFLRYQLTAFPLSDKDLSRQAREMLGKDREESQLVKGPYVSLSRSFAQGEFLDKMVKQERLHKVVAGIAEYERMFAHQEAVFDAAKAGKHCLISTGTGSGKTEAFLYPILDHCLRSKDKGAPDGIMAIIVYPMNALAADQLERLRRMLAGTGISFGMYVGSTASTESDLVEIVRMKKGEGRDKIPDYEKMYEQHKNVTIAPYEERLTEEEMAKNPPRILLTNVNQLEFLLTRGKDLGMFEEAPLRFLVFDEAHTYTGAKGAEVSVLIRRIRAFCNKGADDVICIGTSATLTDPEGDLEAPRKFAQRFFGINPQNIQMIEEIFEDETWPSTRTKPNALGTKAPDVFKKALIALDADKKRDLLNEVLYELSNQVIDGDVPWRTGLYDALKSNEFVKVVHDNLNEPMHLCEATKKVWAALGRGEPNQNDELELLIYLTLGAAAERDGSPILRPKLHYFIRGLGGAVGILGEVSGGIPALKMHFSAQVAAKKHPDVKPTGIFPMVSCKNCGQHYLEAWISDVGEEKEGLTGGVAEDENVYWPRVGEEEGTMVTFTNRFVSEADDVEIPEEQVDRLDKRREKAFICRLCGALHHGSGQSCANASCKARDSLVPIFLLKEHGDIQICPACGYKGTKRGGRIFSPLRPLSAVTVADIHILAQDMITAQNLRNRKLIVFADNRQDAAFQAAWMGDHARRYRLRHLMYRIISESKLPISIGDLEKRLNTELKRDKDIARTLAPEVFAGMVEEAYSSRIEEDMKRFLRISILREIIRSFAQMESLENWGKLRIDYYGLKADDPFIQDLAIKYGLRTDDLLVGIETLLDVYRRGGTLYDEKEPIFTKFWHPGCEEVQRGFLPTTEIYPKALKLERTTDEKFSFIKGLISRRGHTSAEDFVIRWGVKREDTQSLLTDIWAGLTTKWGLLKPVSILSSKGQPISGIVGAFQIDSSKVGLVAVSKRYKCSVCGRNHTRPTPKMVCTSKNCTGRLSENAPPEDDYNISVLEKGFVMLMAKEHTAQVPAKERLHIEAEFKKDPGNVNCLVATPTLELGVDIGALDIVLLRNVPPMSSNYWQRSGRAGRRHRMAVIYTYCRKNIHDEYFFEEPMRLLSGKISPPRFNLRNPIMIEKHVHAMALSELVRTGQSTKTDGISEDERTRIREIISNNFPSFISHYLFEGGKYRKQPPELKGLTEILIKYKDRILQHIRKAFSENWPTEDKTEIDDALLAEYLDNMSGHLRDFVRIFHQRLMWAIITRNNLNEKEKEVARLDEIDYKLRIRCTQYILELSRNGLDNYTLNALARAGYLPGYTTYQGAVTGFASSAFSSSWQKMTFDLNRPDTIAIREFVPGNLIYANGGKYKVSLYHIPLDKGRLTPEEYVIDTATQQVMEKGKTPDGYAQDTISSLKAIPISDVDLAFMSHVSDEEENRFRLPVQMGGYLREEHRGIDIYNVGEFEVFHHHGQKVRLINAGPTDRFKEGKFGYPICIVCGGTRSPYASTVELDRFEKIHKERCGYEPKDHIGFSADSQVDGLLIKGLTEKKDAINLVEGLRLAANICLEMDIDDLQILLFSKGEDEFDALLYDPMPGGSGIIDQMLEDWKAIIQTGILAMENCENHCEKSCYNCLRTYWNMMSHKDLDRHVASALLRKLDSQPRLVSSVPPNISTSGPEGESTNTPEMRLAAILKEHGFPSFQRQQEILLEGSIKRTIPDFYYENPVTNIKIAIYLDGLSKDIHGNEETMRKDHYIRTILRSKGISVVEIAVTELDDPAILELHLKIIGDSLKK